MANRRPFLSVGARHAVPGERTWRDRAIRRVVKIRGPCGFLLTSRPCKEKIQLRRFHKRAKVSISRKQYNARIDTSLRNQCITKACPAPRRQHLRPQNPGSLPESRSNLDLGYLQKCFGNLRRELRIAQ